MHHKLMEELYPAALKPKIHWAVHVIDSWDHVGVLLSCFGPERKHRLMKRIHSFCFNKAHLTTLAHDVSSWMENLNSDCLYQPVHLAGNIRPLSLVIPWPGSYRDITILEYSQQLVHEHGQLRRNDLLQWHDGASVCVGFAIGYGRTDLHEVGHVAFVHECVPRSPETWIRQSERVSMVRAACVVASVLFFEHGDYVVPLLHSPQDR